MPNESGPARSRPRWRAARIGAAAVFVAVAAGLAFVYLGVYDVGADSPHTPLVQWLLKTTRDRSIAVRARNIPVPDDLEESLRIATGAGLYDAMCSDCHLAPGMDKTEISQGLYPPPPDLARPNHRTPQWDFWVIKHGIKLTGMAAWGTTHSDSLVWDMVAFIQRLPALSPAQYRALVRSVPDGHDEMMKRDSAMGSGR